MTTKVGRMVTHFVGLLVIDSHDLLITRSSKITRQTKTNVSPLPQCALPLKLVQR